MRKIIIILLVIVINACCSSVNKNKMTQEAKAMDKDKVILNFKPGPPTIIYKTKKDYNQLVPVILSEDKSTIVSYPHPSDVLINGKFPYPTPLENGYLLDNRGINKNVAFLNMTYEAYSALETAPSLDTLFSRIIDNNPLLEMYYCGNRYTFKNNLLEDLNTLIQNDELSRCKCLTQ